MHYLRAIRKAYKTHIQDKKEEPRFLILTSFFITFIMARLIVYGITQQFLPSFLFGYIYIGKIHVHHLVFGIFLLLLAGFIRIPQFGKGLVKLSSVLYGVGAALTLDEFALWLKFDPNVYFGAEGRISLDAIFIFILLSLAFMWHGKFWHSVIHILARKPRLGK